MTSECVNEPLLVDDSQLRRLRDQLYFELTSELDYNVEPVQPVNAYAIAFAERPSRSIRQKIDFLYSRDSRVNRRAPERGYVYVFRDRRDTPETLVKIGSTVRVPRRMNQWRSELRAGEDDLTLLFSFSSQHVRLTEAIIHTLLFCQWDSKRVNVYTSRRAVEYFAVDDWVALRQVCQSVAAHVDWWYGRQQQQQQQQRHVIGGVGKIDSTSKRRRL